MERGCNNLAGDLCEYFCCWQILHRCTWWATSWRIPSQYHSPTILNYVFNSPACSPITKSWYSNREIGINLEVRGITHRPLNNNLPSTIWNLFGPSLPNWRSFRIRYNASSLLISTSNSDHSIWVVANIYPKFFSSPVFLDKASATRFETPSLYYTSKSNPNSFLTHFWYSTFSSRCSIKYRRLCWSVRTIKYRPIK